MLDVFDGHVDWENGFTNVQPSSVKLYTLNACDLLFVNFM